IEVTGAVKDQTAASEAPVIRTALEAIEHVLGPGPAGRGGTNQLKDDAIFIDGAAISRRAVEVAGLIRNQAGEWTPAVGAASEAVKYGFGPSATGCGRRKLEDRAIVGRSTGVSRAIEITRRIGQQTALQRYSAGALGAEMMNAH